MAFELHERAHLEDELGKIARQQLRKTAQALSTATGTSFERVIHDSRKSLKKVRAVMAFLKQAGAKLPRKDRKRLKAAARALSRLRDSAAIVETLDRVHRHYPARLRRHSYGILRRGLVGARNKRTSDAKRARVGAEVAARLAKTRRSAKRWRAPSISVSDMIAVIAASYRRSRKAMKRARTTGQSATLHRWRKELKTLWYQLRLAKPLTTGIAGLIRDLKQLETDLGEDHNLVVLGATLRSCRDLRSMRAEVRKVERCAVRMRQAVRRHAFTTGRRLHARKPRAFAGWLRTSLMKRQHRPVAA